MKTFRYISALLLGMTLVAAPACDGLLDQYPHNAVSSDNLTDADAKLLLTGLYYIVQNKPTANGYAAFDILGGDLIRGGASGNKIPYLLVQDLVTEAGGFISGQWNGYYTALYQVNNFIQSVEAMAQTTSTSEMLGTAHFFRGLLYYNIASRWGAAPLITRPESKDVGCSPEADVWEFTASEFEQAAGTAPDFTSKNYVSKEAAKALLARTYLAMGRKAEAAALAEDLIASPNFALAGFDKIFRGQPNMEEIFTFANLMEESSVNLSASLYYSRESPVGGSYTYAPTREAMDMFVPDDLRTAYSVDSQGTNDVVNKYGSGEAGTDPLCITRLAEMYLISAEGNGLEKGGLQRLNELRAFRGLPSVSPANERDFETAVLNERRLELFGEGFRWFDLVRTGRLGETMPLEEKYTRFPIPARDLGLNQLLEQNPLWKASAETPENE